MYIYIYDACDIAWVVIENMGYIPLSSGRLLLTKEESINSNFTIINKIITLAF